MSVLIRELAATKDQQAGKIDLHHIRGAMKVNTTLKLDASLIRQVKILAAEEDTSVSALLVTRLEQIVRERKSYNCAGVH